MCSSDLIFVFSFISFFGLFKSNNNFKQPLTKEIIVQVLRFGLVPLGIFLFLKGNLSNESIIAGIVLILIFCYGCGLFFLTFCSKRKLPFLNSKEQRLNKKEKKHLYFFMLPLSVTALSGVFFGYIDTIMLGHFVSGEYIGYYWAAFSLIASASAIINFAGIALFPIFARLKGESLEKAFRKTINITFLISLVGAVITFFFAPLIIKIIYGSEYLSSIILLKVFSFLLIILPLTSVYDSYLISQEKTKVLAVLLVISTLINIVLNYFFIVFGLKFSENWAVIGACIATIISRYFYLFGLKMFRRRKYSIGK